MTKSSVSEYGTPWWSGVVVGDADGRAWASISQMPSRVSQSLEGGPFQFAFRPRSIASVARMAGVHSTVWIFAIRAETISRAVWKTRSSLQPR